MIIPLLLLKFGFNSNWDVLFIDSARIKIIVIPIIFDIVGYLLMTIPYFFWDFNDEKHSKVIQVLRRREEVTRQQYEAEHETAGEEAVEAVEEVKEVEEVMS